MDKNSDFYGDVIARLRAVKHSELKLIAEESGVPEGTVRKIFYGEVLNPRVHTVQALHNYFADKALDSVDPATGVDATGI